jgi:RimJ/RimL family protein N-acetyltransferase
MISESILEGPSVRLRPVEEHDLPRFVEWLADPEVTYWLAAIDSPPTLEEEYDWYESKRFDTSNVIWAMETLDGALIGTIELRLTEAAHRAELGIAIQDKTVWGRGYGADAVRLVLAYAFDELGLNRIELTTDTDNARAIRSYENCGFVREGVLRQFRLRDGQPVDAVIMSVLREDWEAGSVD